MNLTGDKSGSTAIVALLRKTKEGRKLFCANIGDARTVLVYAMLQILNCISGERMESQE
jgi:hypothetical protein